MYFSRTLISFNKAEIKMTRSHMRQSHRKTILIGLTNIYLFLKWRLFIVLKLLIITLRWSLIISSYLKPLNLSICSFSSSEFRCLLPQNNFENSSIKQWLLLSLLAIFAWKLSKLTTMVPCSDCFRLLAWFLNKQTNRICPSHSS